MSVSKFDPALWSGYVPTGSDYGEHIPTPSGSVLLDGTIYAQCQVPDVDKAQEDPSEVARYMLLLYIHVCAEVCKNTGTDSVVRLVELEAYTTRHDVDALKARFAFPKTGEKEVHQ